MSIKLKALIVDDEFANRDLLRILLESYCEQTLVTAMAASVDEAITQIEKNPPDVIFLDVEMPGKDGFSLLESFPNPDFHIVFVTAHEHYAIRALKTNAFDFLLKPIDTDELQATEKRLIEKLSTKGTEGAISTDYQRKIDSLLEDVQRIKSSNGFQKKLYIPTTGGFKVVDADSIECMEADGNYTTVYLKNGHKMLITKSLGELEQTLPDYFYRCHKSFLLNLNHLSSFSQTEGNICETSSGLKIPVSRRKQTEFMEKVFEITGLRNEFFE
ncbi:MAG: response regulator transcription factor [Bacteroidetes bacterium]|nr:response regulator transcription factor [Bacteroidota bacterium]MCH8523325.1 LytTR family DNA-binding domain-containing protein [Balneolales bacterium]